MEFKRQPINDCDIIVLFVLQLADTRLMRAAARTSAYWFMRGKEKCEYTLFSSILTTGYSLYSWRGLRTNLIAKLDSAY